MSLATLQNVIRVTYRLEVPDMAGASVFAMAEKIASDQSTGTFTALPNETTALKAQYAARVVDVVELGSVATPAFPRLQDPTGTRYLRGDAIIDFPLDAIGTDIAALMTITVGGVYAVRGLSGVRVMDIALPQAWSVHPGPQFGVMGSRKLMNVSDGPMIASIIKPSLGLSPHDTADVVKRLCEAGVDFIKDDEKLMSPTYSPLERRVSAIMPVIKDYEQRTGKRVLYAFGISSADPDQMMRNHDIVCAAGGQAAVININSIGYGGMSFLRKRSNLCLHAHRNGWDILTRHPSLGMEFRVYQKIWRLLGVDQFQVNGIDAKYWEPNESFVKSFSDCLTPIFSDLDRALPVVCSGQWGGQAAETYQRTKGALDLMYLGGGGIHGHPMGASAGVKAIRQAWDAAIQGQDMLEYSKTHQELAAAIKQFKKS
ncbi:ribulose-bisphosphate carboxylase [Amylibacter ulvae]|uniref:Ribulose-bisphosphate carboxylase n=1 Tax=Paramylibacter ulvae TaxID=1651968 RepID=A0ABQ3CU65_9RHOB|nr:3-oxo-isoapionate-4-phosphate decarboxylase OiaX [Amylibacter ulvae]GHA44213.1 ribulose-bisphosphate carboxylase [Amylibacter ulvae]